MADPAGREATPIENEPVPTYRGATRACCCPDHGHDWYRRTLGAEVWMECRQCGSQEDV